MAVKNTSSSCICEKCGTKEKSGIAGKSHRRCGGSQGALIRDKTKKLPIAERGVWFPA